MGTCLICFKETSNPHYCSLKCAGRAKRRGKFFRCGGLDCNKSVWVMAYREKAAQAKGRTTFYCSVKCAESRNKKQVEVHCVCCGERVRKTLKHLKEPSGVPARGVVTCGPICAAQWANLSKLVLNQGIDYALETFRRAALRTMTLADLRYTMAEQVGVMRFVNDWGRLLLAGEWILETRIQVRSW